jgi:hypothetical protein
MNAKGGSHVIHQSCSYSFALQLVDTIIITLNDQSSDAILIFLFYYE